MIVVIKPIKNVIVLNVLELNEFAITGEVQSRIKVNKYVEKHK